MTSTTTTTITINNDQEFVQPQQSRRRIRRRHVLTPDNEDSVISTVETVCCSNDWMTKKDVHNNNSNKNIITNSYCSVDHDVGSLIPTTSDYPNGNRLEVATRESSAGVFIVAVVSDEEQEDDADGMMEDGALAATATTLVNCCNSSTNCSTRATAVQGFEEKKRRRRRRRRRISSKTSHSAQRTLSNGSCHWELCGNVSDTGSSDSSSTITTSSIANDYSSKVRSLGSTTCNNNTYRQQQQQLQQTPWNHHPNRKYLAMDCEMVGVGENGNMSLLARVTIVDWDCNIILDQYVRPEKDVVITDYRTDVSGITPEHLYNSNDERNEQNPCSNTSSVALDTDNVTTTPYPSVVDIETCRKTVRNVLSGVHGQEIILIGHGLKNDLAALGIQYPWHQLRDTARYEPFMKKKTIVSMSSMVNSSIHPKVSLSYFEAATVGGNSPETKRIQIENSEKTSVSTNIAINNDNTNKKEIMVARKLKELCYEYLDGMIIQQKQHSSYEDAIAALLLYKKVQCKWEKLMEYKIQKTASIVSSSSSSSSSL